MIKLHPARCTANLPDDLSNENLVSELKMDGSRYLLYIGCDPYERQETNALLSRRVSTVDQKHVDKTANASHFTFDEYPDLENTVLDGEVFLKDCSTTTSVMGSAPKVALAKQKDIGFVTYWVFDIIFYRGKDLRGHTLAERRVILEHVVAKMGNEYVRPMPQWKTDHEEAFRRVIERGGEGTVVKDLRCGYGISWSKYKHSYDVSCFISGFKPGNGKYSSSIGAIALSVYDDSGNQIEVGFASGFDDSVRGQISENPDEWLYKVVDIFAQELSKDGRLRHPTFYRMRPDLDETDCTMTKLKDDIKKNIRGNRKKWE